MHFSFYFYFLQLLPECKALDGADVYLKGGKDISNTSETANTAEAAAAETSEGGAQADANEPTADNATEYAEKDSNKTDRRMPVDVCVDYVRKALKYKSSNLLKENKKESVAVLKAFPQEFKLKGNVQGMPHFVGGNGNICLHF